MQDVDGLYRMPVETDSITDPSHSADASFQLAGNAGDTMDPSGLPTENGDTTSQASLSPGMANIDLPKPVSTVKSTPAVRESILTAKFATKTIPMPIIAQSTPSLYFSAPETFTQPTIAILTPAAVPSAAAEPTPHPAPTLVPATESALIALKPHAPSWIIEGYAHLTKQSLGMEFNRCINVWVAFEEVNGYESSERKVNPIFLILKLILTFSRYFLLKDAQTFSMSGSSTDASTTHPRSSKTSRSLKRHSLPGGAPCSRCFAGIIRDSRRPVSMGSSR
jgi:hypothetical protein